jgi:transcriptional regulator with XRE-family HTH domain
MKIEPRIEKRIRQAISKSGLSLQQVGRLSGVTAGQISHFMNRHRSLTLRSAEKIVAALGLKLTLTEKPRKGTVKHGKRL